MKKTLQRTEEEFLDNYNRYVDMVWKICIAYMKNIHDTEDVVQETFVKYYTYQGIYKSDEHLKAWLIVTATNLCKDRLKHWWKKNRIDFEEYDQIWEPNTFQIDTTLQAVMKLPDKYKTVVYLYYYEGYDSAEIANLLHKNKSTVRNYLCKARELLKPMIGEV